MITLMRWAMICLIVFPPTISAMECSKNPIHLDTVLTNQAVYEFQKGNIHLFDGITGNNQCHINALVIAKLYNEWIAHPESLDKEKIEYLMLNLLLSSSWISMPKKNNLVKRIADTLQTTQNCSMFLSKKGCVRNLLESSDFSLKSYADRMKDTLNERILALLKIMIQEIKDSDTNKEIKDILSESNDTVAKLISSILFIEQNKEWNISILIKVKCICDHGSSIENFIVIDNKIVPLSELGTLSDEAYVVIDAVFLNRARLSVFDHFHLIRSQCPNNFMHLHTKKEPKEHSCLNCAITDTTCTCLSYLMKEDFDELFFAIGARFTAMLQSELGEKLEQFPTLDTIYKHFKEDAHFSQGALSSLFIEHIYPATKKQILLKRLIDHKAEDLYRRLRE